jgi:hypothetical protein
MWDCCGHSVTGSGFSRSTSIFPYQLPFSQSLMLSSVAWCWDSWPICSLSDSVSPCCNDDDDDDDEEELGKLIDQWNKLMPLILLFKSKHTKQ